MQRRSHLSPGLRTVRRERGQALIYGLFILTASLAMLFFMFNTGQLASEKTKLVNTADAVAYSAGVMHARALNFDAYTNRALMANEVIMAQLVSTASWIEYTRIHAQNVEQLNCLSATSVPIQLGLISYELACAAISPTAMLRFTELMKQILGSATDALPAATDTAKVALQAAQLAMPIDMVSARNTVMQEVANANYAGDGVIKVDPIPLTDDFYLFNGAPLIHQYTDDERERLKQVVRTAAFTDSFVQTRSWTSSSILPLPCIIARSGEFKRRGGTDMVGLDEWVAVDTSSLHIRYPDWSWWHGPSCGHDETPLGYAEQTASANANPNDAANFGGSEQNPTARSWVSSRNYGAYRGLPRFFDLRQAALDYGPTNSDPNQRALHVMFSVRVVRDKLQAKTAAGRSAIKPSGALALFQGSEARGILAAIGTSDVFFERADHASGGRQELASLFNPYWQVRLGTASPAALADAIARPPL